MYQNLPNSCYAVSSMDGKIIRIVRGTKGYFETTYERGNLEANKEFVAEMNARLGVSKAQAEAMTVGSIFGWDVPGANPELYDENGCCRRTAQPATIEAKNELEDAKESSASARYLLIGVVEREIQTPLQFDTHEDAYDCMRRQYAEALGIPVEEAVMAEDPELADTEADLTWTKAWCENKNHDKCDWRIVEM